MSFSELPPPLSSLYPEPLIEEPQVFYIAQDNRISRKRALATQAIFTAINLLNYVDRSSIAVILSDVENYFHLDDTQKGLIQTVLMLVYLGAAPLFGYLGDRMNRKYILVFAVLTWSLCTLSGSFVRADSFWLFVLMHGLVGLGESGYVPVCLAMIGDLFPESERMAAISSFSLAIPIGSGLGYILASSVTSVAKKLGASEHVAWKYSMRITPPFGLILIILICIIVRDPQRGAMQSGNEHRQNTRANTSIWQDVKYLSTNKSLVFSLLGFIMVCYVTGCLSFWAPNFLETAYKAKGLDPAKSYISIVFGGITCFSGIAGIVLGGFAAKKLRALYSNSEPLVSSFGLLLAAPMIYFALVLAENPSIAIWPFVLFGEVTLCVNWSIVPKIMIDCVVPHRRAFAAGLGSLLSHLLGDAFGIYLVGIISDASYPEPKSTVGEFKGVQNGLLTCPIVSVVGAMAFLACACFYETDKKRTELLVRRQTLSRAESQSSTNDYGIDDVQGLIIQRPHSISF